jgi:hypothetical protein
MSKQPSEWQKKIEGDWHGTPTVFDAEGNQVGRIKVTRASVFEGDKLTYTMDTDLEVQGPLRARFEAQDFSFGVVDEGDRIYLGPDFVGAGHPYGALVDAHYYSPGWTADLRTMVHVLPDGKTQAYSSLLYDGPTIVAVFNGLYKQATTYGTDPKVTSEIDAFLEREKKAGGKPHVLPFKTAGTWRGEVAVFGGDRAPLGAAQVRIEYAPKSLLRADVRLTIEGPWSASLSYVRSRVGNRHVYEGPEVFGNAIGYGRALYTSQHVFGQATKIKGREFLLGDDLSMSVVWQVWKSDRLAYLMYGQLAWEPGETILSARYER